MIRQFHCSFNSQFDAFTIVWKKNDLKSEITRIYLSEPECKSNMKALKEHSSIKRGSNRSIDLLGKKIQKFLKGENINFDLGKLDFSRCSKIQKKVLLAEFCIPRGWISTYKRIAIRIGIPNGARVIGNSLAKNPFPIVIPCHRAIRSDRHLGGFQGGIKMKKALLEFEGIQFLDNGKVDTDKIYY
jgi:methylated-DNA-[protein]-cysteine S-methyltransferase